MATEQHAELQQLRAFMQYLRGLYDLHLLAWDNDGGAADSVREEMDAPWRLLTDEQQEFLRLLAAAMGSNETGPEAGSETPGRESQTSLGGGK